MSVPKAETPAPFAAPALPSPDTIRNVAHRPAPAASDCSPNVALKSIQISAASSAHD